MGEREKVSLPYLLHKKDVNEQISMLTAYDYPAARLIDEAGIDIILVGDSAAMTVMGYSSTLPVTMAEMLHHCKMVSRGSNYAFLVGDMPFMSYQAGISEAIMNAGRFLKEGAMEAVKLEGGQSITATVKAINESGIPVMGHIGLTPQSVMKIGGYIVQGRTAESAEMLIADALALQDAGCFAIVLEAIPAAVAAIITQKLSIPTIGIGAGRYCNGQVLVFHDILGFGNQSTPKFVKQYANLEKTIREALRSYRQDVETGKFPTDAHTYKMDKKELRKIKNK
jgi:3-methyl-2-oxobutanoate hydroxymethyltransferase